MMFNPNFPSGLAALDQMAHFKAQIAAYRNDFSLMFWSSWAGPGVFTQRRRVVRGGDGYIREDVETF